MNTPQIQEGGKAARTSLAKGNEALRQGDFAQAIAYYAQVILQQPGLAKCISVNLLLARQKYQISRQDIKKPSVAICGWELAHNAAGRAHTLATIYETFAQVEIIGSLFPSFGREIWEPIRDTAIAKHTFVVENESKFIEQAIELVAAHPYDIVHLSKPRASNIFFGILYKLLWGAKVIMDIDDEELAFVGADTHISVDDYLKRHDHLPQISNLAGKEWTRIAVGLATAFDGVTVSNAALQERYGGEIVRHVRDERIYNPSSELRRQGREKFGIPQDKKVVLFFGTPREHKGLIETAEAIAKLQRKDIVFAVIGNFPDKNLSDQLRAISGVEYCFLGNQPVTAIPEVTAIGDLCLLLQDSDATAAQFQMPAKLSDALAMGIPVLATQTPALADVFIAGAIMPVTQKDLAKLLAQVLDDVTTADRLRAAGRSYFEEELSIAVNKRRVQQAVPWHDHPEQSPLLLSYRHAVSAAVRSFMSSSAVPQLDILWQMVAAYRRQTTRSSDERIVVFTAVTGGYDVLRDPKYVLPNCDYIVFADRPLDCKVWQVHPLNYYEEDIARAARFVKLHPHLYFPNHRISIWIDANISLEGDPQPFIDCLGEDGVMALFPHPHRNCIYVEARECIKRSKDGAEVIEQQVSKYKARAFPEDAGLFETGVLVRRHMDPKCKQLMAAWWKELFLGSRRDQISLPVAIHDTGAPVRALAEKGTDLRFHPLLGYQKHPPVRQASTSMSSSFDLKFPCTPIPDTSTISVDIGVCVHNSPQETLNCIRSVIAVRGPRDRLIIVDDASGQETTEMLRTFADAHERVLLIRHSTNQGYTRSANDVLRASVRPYTILLNSDTVMPPGTVRRLVACGEKFPQLGILGPLSNAAGWQSVPQLHAPGGGFQINEIPPGLTIDDMSRLCAQASSGIVPFVPLVNGFCFAVKRTVIDSIGYLDEEAFPIGYGEEDDYCLRAGNAGFICGIVTDAYVYHVKSVTFTSERRKTLAKEGGAALRAKHTRERVEKSVAVTQHHPELVQMRARILELLANHNVPPSWPHEPQGASMKVLS